MLLSRFWYVVLSIALGVAVYTLYLAQSMYNRAGNKVVGEGLSSDSQVVSWYLRDTARERAGHLLKFALHPKVVAALAEAGKKPDAVPSSARDSASSTLTKLAGQLPKESAFDAVFAVDRYGRVVGQFGFPQTQGSEFELGGYPLVADALHGYIRDGSLVWDRIHLAVARPVEATAGELPVGAVVGVRTIDEAFAQAVSQRTGAAVAFYKDGERVAAAVPEGFLKAELDGMVADIKSIGDDKDYAERGRSKLRRLTDNVGAVYSKLPGMAWELGVGYVVGRKFTDMKSPISFLFAADDKDKQSANFLIVGVLALLGIALGFAFAFLEHTRPLKRFTALTVAFAEGKEDQVQASKLGGMFRKLATLINDGVDHAVAKGGGSRRAADLQSVLGDIPEQPAMSAFSFPDAPTGKSEPKPFPAPPNVDVASAPGTPKRPLPEPPARQGASSAAVNLATTLPEGAGARPAVVAPAAGGTAGQDNWQTVYQQFVETKRNCGESVETLTYAKFEGTLRKNQAAIQQKHGVSRVKFTVYVKEGKAALKASPIRD